jgi:hypothetical protein
VSTFWSHALRVFYWFVTRLEPLVRPWVEHVGLGNVVELVVPGRRTRRRIVVLLGLLEVGGERYLGHPNGRANWTRNLDAADGATLVLTHRPPVEVRVDLLPPGEERNRVIAATWSQHVFPGNVIYWLARRHIFAVGRYYRIRPGGEPASTTDRTSSRDDPARAVVCPPHADLLAVVELAGAHERAVGAEPLPRSVQVALEV